MTSALRPYAGSSGVSRVTPLRTIGKRAAPSDDLTELLTGATADLVGTLAFALQHKVAVMVAATSAGSAISLTAYLSSERVRGYASTAEELLGLLSDVRDACEAEAFRGASKSQNGRTGGSAG
jgi:hypothetical protein